MKLDRPICPKSRYTADWHLKQYKRSVVVKTVATRSFSSQNCLLFFIILLWKPLSFYCSSLVIVAILRFCSFTFPFPFAFAAPAAVLVFVFYSFPLSIVVISAFFSSATFYYCHCYMFRLVPCLILIRIPLSFLQLNVSQYVVIRLLLVLCYLLLPLCRF